MSYLFSIILVLINSILISITAVWFNHWTGWNIASVSIFFIIPVGSIILGAGSGVAWYFVKKYMNIKILKFDFLILGLSAVFTFLSVYYISYRTTYISLNKSIKPLIVYQFKKPQNYTPIHKNLTFSKYLNLLNSAESQHTVYHRGAREIASFKTGKTINTILFYFTLIASILGGLALFGALAVEKYCDKCKQYYKNKHLKKTSIEELNKHANEMNSSTMTINNSALKRIINIMKLPSEDCPSYVNIELLHCPICCDSELFIQFFTKNSENKYKEQSDSEQKVTLSPKVAMTLLRGKKQGRKRSLTYC